MGLGSSERISLNKPTTIYTYRRGIDWSPAGTMGRAWANKSGTGTKCTLSGFLNFWAWKDYM